MSISILRSVLLWSTILNFASLLCWFLLIVLPHGWLYRLWGRWFRLSVEQFDALNFGGIVLYKILILIFNLVPYVALLIAA